MFKPARAPKEGRSPPGLPFSTTPSVPRARFSLKSAVSIFSMCMLFAIIFLVLVPNADQSVLSSASYASGAKNWDFAMKEVRTGVETASQEVVGGGGPVVAGQGNVQGQGEAPAQAVQQQHKEEIQPKIEYTQDHVEGEGGRIGYGGATEHLAAEQPSIDDRWNTVAQQKLRPEENRIPSSRIPPSRELFGESRERINSYGGSRNQESDHSMTPLQDTRLPKRPGFEKALRKVIGMLPDEVHTRELIRAIDGTGKERLREFGLRTRAYKKYFDAWEALHFASETGESGYIHDDIIQYLRSRQSADGFMLEENEPSSATEISQVIRSYEAYRTFMTKFANLLFPWTAPWFGDHMSLHAQFKNGGRGIVLTAGDDQAPYLLTTIWSFRQLGCVLPIEIMYLGDQDLGEDYRAELEALPGVVTRDIAQMTNDEGWRLDGWAAKPFAILLSSFREVIFIDADSLFFKNPAVLFETEDYVKTGALFFKDRLIMPENRRRWLQQILPKPIPKAAKQSRFWTGESGHMQESGCIVVDKWKHFIALLLVTRMNGPDRDGNKDKGRIGVYDMVYGDKETFWLGWLLAGDEGFAFHRGDAAVMGQIKDPEKAEETSSKKPKNEKERKNKKRDDPLPEQTENAPPPANDVPNASSNIEPAPAPMPVPEEPLPPEPVAEVKPPSPSNYTICSPQLLHVDEAGKPLWFNGWLLDNKYADKSKQVFQNFEEYLIEPRDFREPTAWQLGESNMCCLTSDADRYFVLDQEEKAILKMIMDRAREVKARSLNFR